MSNTSKPKQKKCKVCGKKFPLFNSLAMVCSVDCSIKYGRDNKVQEKVRKQLNKIARDKIKTRSEHLKDAQTVFNAFIRERDKKHLVLVVGDFTQGKIMQGIIEQLDRILSLDLTSLTAIFNAVYVTTINQAISLSTG